jgi:hypothetical protein
MSGAFSYGVSGSRMGLNVLDGSLARFNARELNLSIHNIKVDDRGSGLVELQDGVLFSLTNILPQIADDQLSKVDFVESYDKPCGTSEVRDLQFVAPVNSSVDGATITVVRHKCAYIETAATQSYEISVHGVADDTDAVVRNSNGIGEPGPRAIEGRARGAPIDSVSDSQSLKGFSENHMIAGDGGRRPSVCLQRYLTPHSSLTSRGHSWSLAE